MPAPLPRYDDVGIRIAPVQPISPTAATAAAQVGETLVQNMHRLTTFAFKEAEETAKAQGLEYGAKNAPTPEQIRVAAQTGDTSVMPGDLTTTFGRASRASALSVTTQAMQAEALQKMTLMRAEAKAADLPAEKLAANMQAMIDGYGTALGQVSPASAASLRASLATTANSAYLAHLEQQIAREEARKKIQAQGAADALIQGIDDDIAAGNRVDPKTGAVTTVDQLIGLKRVQILQMAAATNDPTFAKDKLKQLNDAVTKAKVAVVARWSVDPSTGVPSVGRFHQVMTDSIDKGGEMMTPEQYAKTADVASMWSSMSIEEKVAAQDEIRRQMKGQLELDAAMGAQRDKQRSEAKALARIDFRKAWVAGDTNTMNDALARMDKLGDSDGYEKHASIMLEKRASTEQGLLLMLESQANRNTLTEDRIFELVQQRRLSDDDARNYLGKLDTIRERNFQTAMDMVKGELGYPDKGIIRIGNSEDRIADQRVARIRNALIEAKRVNPDMDVYAEAQKQVTLIKNSGPSADTIRAWQAQIDANKRVLGLPADATLQQFRQALAADAAKGRGAAIGNDATKAALRAAIEQLEKLEGGK